VIINPWVFLAQIQTKFGGEFFLENTAALYDFRYSQIVGQLQSWSVQNSDLAWWQPWAFDGVAFGLSLALVLLSGWLLWRYRSLTPWLLSIAIAITVVSTYFLLARYFTTDQQFGPLDDNYSRALNMAVAQAGPNDQIGTVAQYYYHVPMNRFKADIPIIGFAQQTWPPPDTALPLLKETVTGENTWLITIGFPPAAADNATEQWLASNVFKASDEWLDDVRLIRFGNIRPTKTRPINTTLGQEVTLIEVKLTDILQAGQTLPVEFVWLPLSQPQTDYHLFLQLFTTDGILVAQHDSPPNGGYTPTSTWQAGQQILDRHALALPPDLAPDNYRLIAGLYNPATERRLPINTVNDFIELGTIKLNVPADENIQ
jgi:hypothetical protein